MKNKTTTYKIVATLLSLGIFTGAAGSIFYIQSINNNTPDSPSKSISLTSTSDSNLKKSSNDLPLSKDETVYVLTKTDGSIKKIIVSDWLKNTINSNIIQDYTELDNIVNLKDDSIYSSNDNSTGTWNANGNDIYYQGTTEKRPPIEISIKYTLDDKPISPEDLMGKCGRVTIHFDYKNNEKKSVQINNKSENIYVPFVTVTGLILDNDKFSNIQISNGKIINDNDRSIVMGFALPGMKENLSFSSNSIEIPSSFDISADVNNFSLDTSITIATNDIFNNISLDNINDIYELKESISKLSDASNKLMDGSSELYNGLETLLSKSGEIVSGIDALASGSNKLLEGAEALNNGSLSLKAGIESLSSGLKELNNNNDILNNGAKTIFNTLLATANSQISAAGIDAPNLTIDNYTSVLDKILGSLSKDNIYNLAYNKALDTVTNMVNSQSSLIQAEVENTIKTKILENVLTSSGIQMTVEEYKTAVALGEISKDIQIQVETSVESKINSEEFKAQVDNTVKAKIQDIISEKMQSKEIQSQINVAISQAEAGENSISQLKAQLDSYNEFYLGLQNYTSSVNQAYLGSSELTKGANKLYHGSSEILKGSSSLNTGLNTLRDGSSSLISGVGKLKDGSMQLSNGMNKFTKSGIEKLINTFNGDVDNLINRFNSIINISKDYQNFSGKSNNMTGTVKFIYKTDSIG